MTQSFAHGGKPEESNEGEVAGQVHYQGQSTDDLLAEIDGLLESNAEEFVRSYVQKGGE